MMSTISVTGPASSIGLLTIPQARIATGVETGRDTELTMLVEEISAEIASLCNVRGDGTNPPTLLRETVTETWRPGTECMSLPTRLYLSRRPVKTGLTVTEGGATLTENTDYRLEPVLGAIDRIVASQPIPWSWWAGFATDYTIVAVYEAGLASVEPELRAAAMELARLRWTDKSRDPGLRAERVDGVGSVEYWVRAAAEQSVPASVLDRLARYRTWGVG